MAKSVSPRQALIEIVNQISPEIPDWEEMLLNRRSALVTFCNPYSVYCVRNIDGFLDLLRQFDYVFADGVLLLKAARYYKNRELTRLSFDGNSLASPIWEICRKHQLPVALIGGAEGIARNAGEVLAATGVDIVYTHSGFFQGESHRVEVLEKVKELAPAVTVIGMGAPHQERFAIRLREVGLNAPIFTCGGYLDQMVNAGQTNYYPEWVNRTNTRAIYRLCKEPRRLFGRYTRGYADFYFGTLHMMMTGREKKATQVQD